MPKVRCKDTHHASGCFFQLRSLLYKMPFFTLLQLEGTPPLPGPLQHAGSLLPILCVFILLGCHYKVPQMEWLQQQQFICSQFMNEVLAGLVSPGPLSTACEGRLGVSSDGLFSARAHACVSSPSYTVILE